MKDHSTWGQLINSESLLYAMQWCNLFLFFASIFPSQERKGKERKGKERKEKEKKEKERKGKERKGKERKEIGRAHV